MAIREARRRCLAPANCLVIPPMLASVGAVVVPVTWRVRRIWQVHRRQGTKSPLDRLQWVVRELNSQVHRRRGTKPSLDRLHRVVRELNLQAHQRRGTLCRAAAANGLKISRLEASQRVVALRCLLVNSAMYRWQERPH